MQACAWERTLHGWIHYNARSGFVLREISQEVDYVMESVSLLQHLGAGETYKEMRESLSRKYAKPFREGLRKFEVLEQIEQAAVRVFSGDMEQIQFYFPARDSAQGCAGNLVLLWEDFKRTGFGDVAAFANSLRELSEQEYCERFGICLQGYTAPIVREVSEAVIMSEPYAVISYLMRMDIKDEEKWKIQKIFFDRTEHLEKLIGLLEKAEKLLLGFQKELNEIVQLFCRYWSKELDGRDPASYIIEETNINVESSPLGYRLQPSIICPNVLMLNNDMGDDGVTYEEPDYYRIGILFGEDFGISVDPGRQNEGFENYAMQVLKILADKSKFEILSYIRDKEAYGSELAKHLNLTTATVSHHMNALLTAGLVKVSHIDNRVYYTANQKALEKVLDYCKGILIC